MDEISRIENRIIILNQSIDKITNSNFDNETKEVLLSIVKDSILELSTRLISIKNNLEFITRK